MRWLDISIILGAIALVGLLLSCGQTLPAPVKVPAEQAELTLESQVESETTAAVTDSHQATVEDQAAAAPALPPEIAAQHRATADRLRASAERHRALVDELKQLRDEAHRRAKDERQELDDRAAAAAKAADDRRLSWCVGIAIALATGAGGLLTWLGVPRSLALGIPGAVIAGALALSAWIAAGAWIALILGAALVLAVIAGLAGLVVVVIREWHHSAAAASEPASAERDALNAASLARQPAWARWILNRLLPAWKP